METMDPNVVFGPIADLIADPTIEEIWINSPQRIFIARAGKSQLTNLVLTSDEVKQLVDRAIIWSEYTQTFNAPKKHHGIGNNGRNDNRDCDRTLSSS